MTEFFRHCPECGCRFHIKLENKKLVNMDRTSRPRTEVTNLWQGSNTPSPPVFVLQEGTPLVVDVEEFDYSYKCKHCGHEWTEKHVERHKE